MQGPFVTDAAPEFGHQLKLVPRDIYRVGIAALERWSKANQGKPFAELEPSAQDDILQRLEAGQIDLQDPAGQAALRPVAAKHPRRLLLRSAARRQSRPGGWKLVGFPGARADFMDWADRGEKYPSRRWRFPARGLNMATTLKPVDAVVVGFGWTGAILAKELTEAGLNVVALERGENRDTYPDGAYPNTLDELTYNTRGKLFQNLQEHREHPPRDQRHRAALPSALRLPSRRRRRWRRPALVRRAFPDHARGTAPAQPLRGTLRQEIHPRRHDHPGLRGQLRRAGAALRFRREGLRHLRHRAYGQGPGGRQGQSVRRRPLGRLPAAGAAPGVLRATVPQGAEELGLHPTTCRRPTLGPWTTPTGCRWGRATSAASAAATPATCIPRPRRT